MITGKGTAKHQTNCSLTLFDEPGTESIDVLSFQSTNHGLCQHYQFVVVVAPASNLLSQLHLGKRISININLSLNHNLNTTLNQNFNHNNRNRIKTFRIDGYLTAISDNTVVLESPLYVLMLHQRCKVYRNITVPELILTILTQIGWSRENYEVHLLSNFNYPTMSTLTQYNLTDFDFLEKHLSCWGFIYYFRQDHDDDFCKLIITDELIPHNHHPRVQYCSTTAMIAKPSGNDGDDTAAYCLETELTICAENVIINNYDYQQPKQNLQLESKNASGYPGHGLQYCYGEPYTTLSQGLRLLKIRQEALDCQRYRLTIKTNAVMYQLGDLITIPDLAMYSRHKNTTFRIIAIQHNASQRPPDEFVSTNGVDNANDAQLNTLQRSLSYSSTIYLIEINCPFRQNYYKHHQYQLHQRDFVAPRNQLIPSTQFSQSTKLNFYQLATIESIANHDLDEQGRYRIRYPFDENNPQGAASDPLRLMQPHTGNLSGHHWPLHHGTHVVVGFVNHDIDRPFIVGTLSNDVMPSTVTAHNPQQHILRSYAGNELLINDAHKTLDASGTYDTSSNPKIRLSTPFSRQSVILDAKPTQPQITLNAHVGDIRLHAGDASFMGTKANLHHTVSGSHSITAVKNYSLQTQHGDITIQTGNDAKFTAKKSVALSSAKNNIVVKSGGNTVMHSQRGFSWTINKGNFSMLNPDGQLKLQAQNNLSIANKGLGNIIVTQGFGKISVNKNGIIHFQGPTITLRGQQVGLTGLQKNLIPIGLPATPVSLPTNLTKLWLRLGYLAGDKILPAINHAYTADSTNFATASENADIVTSCEESNGEHCTGHTDQNGVAILDSQTHGQSENPGTTKSKINNIAIINSEIIKIHSRLITNPNESIEIIPTDINETNSNENVDTDHKNIENIQIPNKLYRYGDKIIDIGLIYPPIIINLREDASDIHARKILTKEEINYFKYNGNNATLFIHGFNVTYGSFSKQISGIEGVTAPAALELLNRKDMPIKNFLPKYSASNQTVYCDRSILSRRIPELDESNMSPSFYDDKINGTGAHNWFVHMEDNLNRASNQFNRTDYSKYTRFINVAWSGDVAVMNYFDAEDVADRAGHQLIALILQLQAENIATSVIAHSLGNRVLLTAMESLAKDKNYNCFDYVFLWQPALPNTALSTDPSLDATIKQNSKFIHANQAAKSISVLFSQHDDVLRFAYKIANEVGTSIDNVFSRSSRQQRDIYMREVKQGKASNKELVAMGLLGPDRNTIGHLGNRLSLVNQTPWLYSHSGMRVPSADLFENVYKNAIFQARGYRFGSYKG